jgi:hypothetical protein
MGFLPEPPVGEDRVGPPIPDEQEDAHAGPDHPLLQQYRVGPARILGEPRGELRGRPWRGSHQPSC